MNTNRYQSVKAGAPGKSIYQSIKIDEEQMNEQLNLHKIRKKVITLPGFGLILAELVA